VTQAGATPLGLGPRCVPRLLKHKWEE
jgi:hypothetical protein